MAVGARPEPRQGREGLNHVRPEALQESKDHCIGEAPQFQMAHDTCPERCNGEIIWGSLIHFMWKVS